MLSKLIDRKEEGGFTLVELLVVILIIGILSAIAIPAFLNQRKTANDASVESDVKNIATQIETALVASPNAEEIIVATTTVGETATITVDGELVDTVNLSDGVTVATDNTVDNGANGYVLHGSHSNGKQYLTGTSNLEFNSAAGGIQ